MQNGVPRESTRPSALLFHPANDKHQLLRYYRHYALYISSAREGSQRIHVRMYISRVNKQLPLQRRERK